MSISQRIFSLLKEKKYTIQDLATKINANDKTIYGWKSRNKNPPSEYIAPIAAFLDVSPEYLLTGKEAPTPSITPLPMPSLSPPTNLTNEESLLLNNYRQLSLIDRVKVRGLTIELLRAQENAANLDTKKHPIQKGQGA